MENKVYLKFLRRLAAIGAWLQAVLLIEMLLTVLFFLPAITGITAESLEGVYIDPSKYLVFVHEHGFLRWMLDPDLPFAIVYFITVWGVGAHLREKSRELSWVATTIGVVSSAFFLGVGMIEMVSVPELAHLYLKDPISAASGYHGVTVLWNGIAAGALFTNGIWILIVGVAGLRGSILPRSFCYLGLLPALSEADQHVSYTGRRYGRARRHAGQVAFFPQGKRTPL